MSKNNFEDYGFVPLWRSIFDWEWYKEPKIFKTYIHCFLKANYTDKQWQGKIIKRGQFVTSIKHLSEETGLSEQNVRTAIKNLTKTGELTIKTTNRNTIITVNNYDTYNDLNKQITDKQQTNNNQVTTTNKDNNINNENNVTNSSSCSSRINNNFSTTTTTPMLNDSKKLYGEFGNVCLSDKEYIALYNHLKRKMPKQSDDIYKTGIDIIIKELDDLIDIHGENESLKKVGCTKHSECLHKFINQKFTTKCIENFGTFINQIYFYQKNYELLYGYT